MDYELISAEEFDKLPEDDEQCFVEFEAICHRNMTQMMEECCAPACGCRAPPNRP
jgi:hypothetical protein